MMRTDAHPENDERPATNGAPSEPHVSSEETGHMVQTAEGLAQRLREKTRQPMALAFRIIQLEQAAKRVHHLAFLARCAYEAGSLDECATILTTIDHAGDFMLETHVQFAKVAIDAEITERAS